ncbi:MAG: tetratricopeptide repeat protein [Magnetococcales bacterium]|nr:tetratricopeptide repeat protein [Magnetococcales bacterium]
MVAASGSDATANTPLPELLAATTRALAEGDLPRAGALANQAMTLAPQSADAHHLMSLVAQRAGKPPLAIALAEKAISLDPDHLLSLFNLGNIRLQQQQFGEAEPLFQRILALDPANPGALINLANIRFHGGRHQEAIGYYRRALLADPAQPTAYYNLGVISQEYGRHDDALAFFDQGLRLQPDSANLHTAKAFSHLMLGDFAQGWKEYEWRWQIDGRAPRICPRPRWDGTPLEGKRIYLYTEQGFGDALQFARFAPMVRERGGRPFLECKPEMLTLFASSDLAEVVTARGEGDSDPPPFDYDCHLPLMSLPGLLGITPESLPGPLPYLKPTAAIRDKWRQRLANLPGLKVGIAWSGNPQQMANRFRACRLALMAPLFEIPGIHFLSLQKGPPAKELVGLTTPPSDRSILDMGEELTDFAETAGLLSELDLLISTDTAVIHLAGGVGCRTWTLLHTASEWRWLQHRSDSPWYPTMRLYRQERPRDWPGVIARVRADLEAWAYTRAEEKPPKD